MLKPNGNYMFNRQLTAINGEQNLITRSHNVLMPLYMVFNGDLSNAQ